MWKICQIFAIWKGGGVTASFSLNLATGRKNTVIFGVQVLPELHFGVCLVCRTGVATWFLLAQPGASAPVTDEKGQQQWPFRASGKQQCDELWGWLPAVASTQLPEGLRGKREWRKENSVGLRQGEAGCNPGGGRKLILQVVTKAEQHGLLCGSSSPLL